MVDTRIDNEIKVVLAVTKFLKLISIYAHSKPNRKINCNCFSIAIAAVPIFHSDLDYERMIFISQEYENGDWKVRQWSHLMIVEH